MVVPGTMLVFVATWLYMESAPPKKGKEKEDDDLWLSKKREKQYSTSVRLEILLLMNLEIRC